MSRRKRQGPVPRLIPENPKACAAMTNVGPEGVDIYLIGCQLRYEVPPGAGGDTRALEALYRWARGQR